MTAPQEAPGVRLPPYSLEAEQAVIGALLQNNTAWDTVGDACDERDFYTQDHRKLFRAVSLIINQNKPADVVTVAEFLQRHGELEAVGGMPYLVQLTNNTTSANARRYAEIVREHSITRRLIGALMESEQMAYAPGGKTTREVLDFAQSRVMNVTESAQSGNEGPEHVSPVVARVIENIDTMYHRDVQDDVTGLTTGFPALDSMTAGLQPGDLIIVAARPSMGKTAISLNIAEHVAIESKKNVLFFSLEMINNQLGTRLLASVSRINQQRVKIGRINDHEWQRLTDAVGKLASSGIYLDESSSISATEIRARARRLHRECGGLHLIVIDYLQLIQTSGKSDNRAFELAEVSRALKMLAKELHVPVIALSQLNRSLEQRPNKRPIMSDLRDSGGIEQDADLILFVYRDEVYHEDSPDKGIAELVVGKQRNGPTGTVHVNFRNELIRFEHRDKHEPIPSRAARAERQSSRASSAAGRPTFRDIQESGYVDM